MDALGSTQITVIFLTLIVIGLQTFEGDNICICMAQRTATVGMFGFKMQCNDGTTFQIPNCIPGPLIPS